jgi:PadR family transcriptional regulator
MPRPDRPCFILRPVCMLCSKLRILGMGRKPQKNDSLPGSLDMLILRTLSRARRHGYAIVQAIRETSDDEILVEEGSLYPALQRMLKAGWVKARWGLSPTGRRVRTYELTAPGKRRLRDEMSRFERMLEGIQLVLAPEEA